MKKIDVKLQENPYTIYLDKNNYGNLWNLLNENNLSKKAFFVIDKNLYAKHKNGLDRVYKSFTSKKYLLIFEPSEEKKSFESLQSYFEEMLKLGFGRDTVVIAIGGGITGDIAGFAAAVFARGVQFIQVPTTLLSMVDSSVGGKTGINFEHTKNIIGAFYQPNFVLIDTDFLKTLPEDEIVCGLGEIVKYGFLIDDEFFRFIKSNVKKMVALNNALITKVIEECVKFKAGVVEKDEREETGLRKILNLGHTFAHAFEVEQEHKIKHGQAVIVGLSCALHLSNKLGLLSDENLAKYLSLIVLFADKIRVGKLEINKCYEIMKRDKKNKDEIIKFVLLSSAGKLLIDVEAKKEDVIYAMNNGIQYFID